MTEWISVNDKMPETAVPVLICDSYRTPVVANYAGMGVWMDTWHQRMTYTPEYWMPLPEIPQFSQERR